jgi:3,4-dihydroxy 2-butanone 4-phosphate synthase / GTP cyclohydrolase II
MPVSAKNYPLASVEEIVEEARNGRMFILVDDEDRENEGDLVFPAQMITPAAINFMATHGRGLVCLALTEKRCDELGLTAMSSANGTQYETAFTVSIEAKNGVTTGISAADRARTINVAIDPSCGADAIVMPGHIFPLRARDGGVLVRAGHTEASVDIARLAGLNPSGVICEIMNDDGTMARLPDLVLFAQQHGLKIGTIRDLIAYRRVNDHLVECMQDTTFSSNYGGEWQIKSYRDKITDARHVVLQKGKVETGKPTLVRMHNISVLSDLLGAPGKRNRLLQKSMEVISEEGEGIIVMLRPPGEDGFEQQLSGAREPGSDFRSHGIGAQILAELGVRDVILLTNSQYHMIAIEGYGLSIVGQRSIASGHG